jgi:hypothetical protein
MDGAKNGKGSVSFKSDVDLVGENSEFIKNLKVGDTISFVKKSEEQEFI